MTNKITLAELRREAKRVLGDGCEPYDQHGSCAIWDGSRQLLTLHGARMKSRRRMLKLLRALPDGALKEG